MTSQIQGFEYDIFISYRQKDNKGERWVSEFVEALRTELDSTFKETVSVYFDSNPNDGLLETHDVDASLKKKLKCLIFIPIISRTYCDTHSFAWEHEFKAFIELAASDQYGLKITLPGGNVISRVLPVRIHDLDANDIELCESVLGSVLRGVEFVYRSPGVNRPLRSNEDHQNDNLNKTYYRDQINKLSNSIKEIIESIRHPDSYPKKRTYGNPTVSHGENKKLSVRFPLKRRTIIQILVIGILISVFSVMYITISENHRNSIERTIAIIPLTNPPNDAELSKYAIGSMDAIITKLQEIKSLTIRGRLSSLSYLETKKPLSDIKKELSTNYLLVLNMSRISNNLKIWIGLTKTKNDKQLWAEQYDWNEDQLMPLFTKVVQTIAGNLNIEFNNQEIIKIEKDLTKKPDAYLNYLTASAGLISAMGNNSSEPSGFISAIKLYDKAIEEDSGFANAYARRAIALSWGMHAGVLDSANIERCWSDILAASKINEDLSDVQVARGFYYYYCRKDFSKALISFNIAAEKDPENYQPLFYMAMVYRAMGNWKQVQLLLKKVIRSNLQDPLVLTNIGLSYEYLHNFDSALIYHQKAIDVNPDWGAAYMNKFGSLLLKYGNTLEARSLLNQIEKNSSEKHTEDQIILDMYDGRYLDALSKATYAKPEDFAFKGVQFMHMANASILLNDNSNADNYFSIAVEDFYHDMKDCTNDASLHSYLGLALAGKGNDKEAVKEGKKAVELARKDKNKILEREMILNLAELYTKLGMYKEAFDMIEDSLKNPSLFSVKMLKLDPAWKPLLNRPELKTIVAKYDNR